MSEQNEAFARRCAEIQQKCACTSFDAAECAQHRDDLHPDDDSYMQRHCECSCHGEIAEEEESQEWPL